MLLAVSFYGMIAPHELRIGNWFIAAQYLGGEYCRVNGIKPYKGGYGIIVAGMSLALDTRQNDPIPLDSEVFSHCGFRKVSKNIFTRGGVTLLNKESGFELLHLLAEKATKVMYLHQLQNLYFAIKGEELAVNPAE
jgi:hypothetical protein